MEHSAERKHESVVKMDYKSNRTATLQQHNLKFYFPSQLRPVDFYSSVFAKTQTVVSV